MKLVFFSFSYIVGNRLNNTSRYAYVLKVNGPVWIHGLFFSPPQITSNSLKGAKQEGYFFGYLQITYPKNIPLKECYLGLFCVGPIDSLTHSLSRKSSIPIIEKVFYEPNNSWIQTPEGLFH